MSPDKKKELYVLLHALSEGTISDAQFDLLDQWLGQDREAREIYVDFAQIGSDLKYFQASLYLEEERIRPIRDLITSSEELTDSAIWTALSEAEKTSPIVLVKKHQAAKHPVVAKTAVSKVSRRIGKMPIYAAAASIAAFSILLAYVYFIPRYISQEVATVVDCIDAQLLNSEMTFTRGSRLSNHTEPLWLKKGVVKIAFDYGAEVILEGPAEIELESPEKMRMSYGRLFAEVPGYAAGFAVNTPYSKVIDLGTEFGIKVDVDGTTDLHMFKGKASLIPGSDGQRNHEETLLAGQARQVDNSGKVKKVEFQSDAFVRDISSDNKMVWRGETTIDLADVLRGGVGYGRPRMSFCAIDPSSGQIFTTSEPAIQYRLALGYNRVKDNKNIDGVFIPDRGDEPTVISSAGHVFKECPDTNREWFIPILTEPITRITMVLPDGTTQVNGGIPIVLNGTACGNRENPALIMHANCGITFDLSQIKTAMPGLQIAGFNGLLGRPDVLSRDIMNGEDIWILVDGQVRFHFDRKNLPAELVDISLPLSEQDRFLTFIATDGGDAITYDWWIVVKPTLTFATR